MLRQRADILTGVEWVAGIPINPTIIYVYLAYASRSKATQFAAAFLTALAALQCVVVLDATFQIFGYRSEVTADLVTIASVVAIGWATHTIVLWHVQDTDLQSTAAMWAHCISFLSPVNYVFGLPLSHKQQNLPGLIRTLRVYTALTACFIVVAALWFIYVIEPTHMAWGCYASNSPSNYNLGMCSTQSNSTAWWSKLQSEPSPICSVVNNRYIVPTTCAPSLTVWSKYATFLHGLTTVGITSFGAYLFGCLLVFVDSDTPTEAAKHDAVVRNQKDVKKSLLATTFF